MVQPTRATAADWRGAGARCCARSVGGALRAPHPPIPIFHAFSAYEAPHRHRLYNKFSFRLINYCELYLQELTPIFLHSLLDE